MNFIRIRICVFLVLLILLDSSCSNSKRRNPNIPEHEFFVRKNIGWKNFSDLEYLKKVSSEIDSMVILTPKKIIIIIGQYGILENDTILMPWSGEFGINYDVRENTNMPLFKMSAIKIGGQTFIKSTKVNFQWWDEINDRLDENGSGSVIVSGP